MRKEKPDYRILISTCDKYLIALPPLLHMLRKYWQPLPEIVIGGFSVPDFDLGPGVKFVSCGKQEDYPIGKWSDGLIKFFSGQDDDVFVYFLDDMWPVRPVDGEAVQMLVDYARQFKSVARMDLTSDRFYSHGAELNYGNVGRLDLVKSSRDSEYLSSMMPGAWNRRHFLDLLVPDESPWDIELRGTPRLRNMDVEVYGTRQMPYKCTLAFRGGDSKKLACEIPYQPLVVDVEEMRKLGLLDNWEG